MNNKILKLAAIFLVFGPLTATAMPVTVGGNEWLQPGDYIGFSWNDVAAVCEPTSGVCGSTLLTGTPGTFDLSGWIWASVTDVLPLLYAITPLTSPDNIIFDAGDLDLDPYFALFNNTNDLAFLDRFSGGATRDTDGTLHSNCQVQDRPSGSIAGDGSQDDTVACSSAPLFPRDLVSTRNGAWFFRALPEPPAEVPEPMTLTLLGLGLAGMGFVRRRKKTV